MGVVCINISYEYETKMTVENNEPPSILINVFVKKHSIDMLSRISFNTVDLLASLWLNISTFLDRHEKREIDKNDADFIEADLFSFISRTITISR